ncbi:MAG TPA: hypothetical protein VES68_01340, partial [Candidatus Sulfotelmatobacter sp.]|nr:hypothetical protein [Candidatus Sulfotelmatobacter sp.]
YLAIRWKKYHLDDFTKAYSISRIYRNRYEEILKLSMLCLLTTIAILFVIVLLIGYGLEKLN